MNGKVLEARREMRHFALLMFAIGLSVGVAMAVLYIKFSPSDDKFFHAFVMLAGAGFTFPMFTLSLRLMLRMFYQSVEGMENQSYLIQEFKKKDEKVEPIIDRAGHIVSTVESAVKRIAENGDLEKSLRAIQSIPAKLDAVLQSERKSFLKDL